MNIDIQPNKNDFEAALAHLNATMQKYRPVIPGPVIAAVCAVRKEYVGHLQLDIEDLEDQRDQALEYIKYLSEHVKLMQRGIRENLPPPVINCNDQAGLKRLKKQVSQRGARMQIMFEIMTGLRTPHPSAMQEVRSWFDEHGVVKG